MINCDEFHKFIDDYVYDEVSFFVKAQMDEHIASCPKCREEAEFLKEIKSTLYAMPRLEVDESFKAALNEKLDAAEKTVDRKRRRSFFRIGVHILLWRPVLCWRLLFSLRWEISIVIVQLTRYRSQRKM